MVRFSCPQCGKTFKRPGDDADTPAACPRCGGLALPATGEAEGRSTPATSASAPPLAPRRFGRRGRRLVVGVALVLGAVGGVYVWAPDWTLPAVACSAVTLLAMLHGHGTGCPACGRWWARAEVEKGLVTREDRDAQGVACETLLSQTSYRCTGCGHRWSETVAEGTCKPGRDEAKPRRAKGRDGRDERDRKLRDWPVQSARQGAGSDKGGSDRRSGRREQGGRRAEAPRRRPSSPNP